MIDFKSGLTVLFFRIFLAIANYTLIGLMLSGLVGCGFKLSGYEANDSGSSDRTLSSANDLSVMAIALIETSDGNSGMSELQLILQNRMQQLGQVSDPLNAQRVIRLVDENLARRAVTRNESGRALEYQLVLTVSVDFIGGAALQQLNQASDLSSDALTKILGKDLQPAQEFFQDVKRESFKSYREYVYDNQLILAAHNFEQELLTKMRREIADRILHYAARTDLNLSNIEPVIDSSDGLSVQSIR